jgi:nicotinate-nucleotide adenylyltransferase
VSAPCILILGGSFDPVHTGHVGLAHYCATLLHPDVLRLIPAGQPWQKPELATPATHRMAMLKLAFADCAIPVQFDDQEICRTTPTYTIDTLRALRAELGEKVSIVLAMGADQLINLHTWHQWQQLFDYAHLCVATRPGFLLTQDTPTAEVAREITRRKASAAQLRATPNGLVYLADNLALDVSATTIRQALQQDNNTDELLPRAVLDYIHQHHLYKIN